MKSRTVILHTGPTVDVLVAKTHLQIFVVTSKFANDRDILNPYT